MLRGFKKGWFILLLIVAFQVGSGYFEEAQELPTERRPKFVFPPEAAQQQRRAPGGPILPDRSTRDPLFVIETGEKGNSTGTAFAIRSDGIWLTARHVIDGCDKVGLVTAPGRAIQVAKVLPHPRADIAVLWSRRNAPSISFSTLPLRIKQEGFHFGFPQSTPGQVTSSLLGRLNMRTTGRYRQTEPVIAWAERQRVPVTDTLGGLSGGPVLNANGEIVGVTVAASKRRGRVMTTAPVTMQSMLSMAGVQPAGRPSAGLNTGPDTGNFVEYGTALRRQLTVAQVICRVGDQRRRPRTRRL